MRMEPSDTSLAQAAAGGDRAAFETLLLRHYDRVFRIGFRFLGQEAEAEDLAQDVCVALPGKLAQFQGHSAFTTWLTSIVINAARDRLRRRATQANYAKSWGDVETLRRAEADETRAALDWLSEAMGRLTEPLRETAILVVGEDMSHAAAGEALGVAEGTIAWRMSEIKKNLRQMAKDEVA